MVKNCVEQKEAHSDFSITLVRHGLTDYLRPYNAVDLVNDRDLTVAGEAQSRLYAQRLSKQLIEEKFDGEIAIISSPIVRAVHTARLYSEEIQKAGLNIRMKGRNNEFGVKVLEALTEVKGFNWHYFNVLVEGGEVIADGQKYLIDAAESNPANLNHSEYFLFDAVNQIDLNKVTHWPNALKKFASDFERHQQVWERVFKLIGRLETGVGHLPAKVLLFSHDGAATLLMDMVSGGEQNSLERGNYLTMKKSNAGLYFSEVMGEGVEESIFVGKWQDYFQKRVADAVKSDKVY